MGECYLQEVKLKWHAFQLYMSSQLFLPNATTTRFSRFVDGLEGACVFDMGTGVGPLAVWAAKEGAREVHAVDPVEEHIRLARMNAALNCLDGIVYAYHGNLFSPLEGSGIKADVIIGDVSGISDKVARVLKWYPPQVPTGGEDGTDVIRALIEESPSFLAEKGILFFPMAIDVSDYERIREASQKYFKSVTKVSDISFPVTSEQVLAIEQDYNGKLPDFIKPQKSASGRLMLRGEFYKASRPRS